MGFQEQLNELSKRFNAWLSGVQRYFGQLNDEERYAWIGEGTGFALVVAGVVLLFF